MTISDIAKMAGVSSAAVSRYLNGGPLSEQKREAIREVVEKTGYRPDAAAQTLRTGRVNQIGVIAPSISSQSVGQITAGIASELDQQNYLILLGNTELDEQRELGYLTAMQRNHVAGIILLGCGHRRLAYIGGTEKDQAVGLARRQGVQDALNAAGLNGDKLPRLCCSAFTMEEGERCMNELLACCPDLDGVVCVTDTVALGAMRALRAAGRAIGTQVSLAGIGDSWVGGVVEPGLTTVRFYQKQVGVEAARMLLQMLEHPENGGPVRQTTLGYSVVDRGSIRIKEDA